MHCHVCNVAVGEGQQFCHECGESLKGVTDPTEPITAIKTALDDDVTIEREPVSTATPDIAVGMDSTALMDTVAAFEPTAIMATTQPPGAASGFENTVEITDQMPQLDHAQGALFDGAADVTTYPVREPHGFRLRASFVFAVLGLLTTLMASVADIVEVQTSRPVDGIEVGLRTMEEFGTNLTVAGIVGASMMLFGSLLSCFGLRWGAGMAGGSGLALVGWAALTLGLVEVPINKAELVTRTSGADVNGFTLFITRDLGWFLIVAVAAVGLLVFLASLRMAGSGGRPGLNPWIAAIGTLAMVIVAAGPLIPLGGSAFDVNLGTGTLPREFFASRLIQLGLIALTGVLGFLAVRTYGLGFAVGGIGVSVWLWVATLGELGDQPIGIAVGNIGTSSTVPHAVTTVGMVASLAMIAVAAALAIASRPRH